MDSPPSDFVVGFDADDTLWHNESIFEKTHERYRALLAQFHDAATVDRTLFATEMRNLELAMVGNSLKSDILPVLALGGAGVHVPYRLTWAAERVEDTPRSEGRFFPPAHPGRAAAGGGGAGGWGVARRHRP